MHCAGPSGLFGREFVSVDRSVNKHSFQTCSGSLPWMLRYIAELNLWKRWSFVIGSLWADPDWFTVASDAPINSFVTGDWFVLWNWVSGINLGGFISYIWLMRSNNFETGLRLEVIIVMLWLVRTQATKVIWRSHLCSGWYYSAALK